MATPSSRHAVLHVRTLCRARARFYAQACDVVDDSHLKAIFAKMAMLHDDTAARLARIEHADYQIDDSAMHGQEKIGSRPDRAVLLGTVATERENIDLFRRNIRQMPLGASRDMLKVQVRKHIRATQQLRDLVNRMPTRSSSK